MPSFILCVRPLLGAWPALSLHYTRESQASSHHFSLGMGILDTGHHTWENAQLSLFLDHYRTCKMLGFSTQDKRDAPESEETHDREDGQPEVLGLAHSPPAHGGQHAQPAGHHGARAAAPELVATEDTDHGVWEQPHRWAGHAPSVTFSSHMILTPPVAEKSQSSFQEKGMGFFWGGGRGRF